MFEKIYAYKFHILAFILGTVVGGAGMFVYKQGIEPADDSLDLVEKAAPETISPSKIGVDLGGAVHAPGMYYLDVGARIADLLAVSGGINVDASVVWVSKNLNLSKKLSDTEKIYIPFDWEVEKSPEIVLAGELSNQDELPVEDTKKSGPAQPDSNIETLLNINIATQEELDTLPGIGPAYAAKIITSRPYISLDELVTKAKLPSSTFEKIKSLIILK